ncbi:MAG: putative periplasmic protein [Myxococcales bacterium]|nr:putative periplasmic protein [Myxococcales bacterium]
MRFTRELAAIGAAVALLGCGGGCDGDRLPSPQPPRSPTVAVGDAGLDGTGEAPTEPRMPGFLDAPAGGLDHLFSGLAAAERGEPNARTLIVFFGDSHTAGDSMTSRIRAAWQRRFGDAGRGLVAAGRPPAKHYYQRDVRYGASGTWKAAVGGKSGDSEPFGIGGIRVFGDKKGSQLWVETCADCPTGKTVAQFEILYQAAPDHGVLRYRVDDGAWQQVSTKTAPIEPPHPARQVVAVPEGHHKLTLEHGGGGMLDLYGVVLERLVPGVIVDSLGVVGRRLGSLRSWDWSIIGEQLATRDPRLIVLQYGTNEADDRDLDLVAVARYYDETILRLRAAAPTASILILGPPDMGVREGGKACDRMKPTDAGVVPECEWRTPSVLGEIIAVQHAAAARNKVAFFDTFSAMGGPDRMHGWVMAEPRGAFKDHVHFTDGGYQQWADVLSGALLREYDRWRVAKALPPHGVAP